MKLWIDDLREPVDSSFVWLKSVNGAIMYTAICLAHDEEIELIDIDHDAGYYYKYGGDYIKYLDWLEQTNILEHVRIHIHSGNTVGIENMRRIIKRNKWEEVQFEWE
jgi:hypothetical protein